MSQSETLLLIVLGFAIAFIVVLLFGRMAWNIATRLGAKRKQREIPATMLDLQADRDRLRAEQAMLSRKLELRLEDVKMRMAEQMAEVSRNRNRIEIMTKELVSRDETIAQNESEIERIKAVLKSHDLELHSRAEIIERLSSVINAKDVEINKLTRDMILLSSTLRDKTAKLSNLGVELENAVRSQVATVTLDESTEDRIRRRISEMTVLSNQMSSQNDQDNTGFMAPVATLALAPAPAAMSSKIIAENLEEKLAYAERQTQELDEELKRLDEVWSEKLSALKSEDGKAVAMTAETTKRRGGLNVISLAQRIRALQRGMGD
jgi:chromosome segregation ATPase